MSDEDFISWFEKSYDLPRTIVGVGFADFKSIFAVEMREGDASIEIFRTVESAKGGREINQLPLGVTWVENISPVGILT